MSAARVAGIVFASVLATSCSASDGGAAALDPLIVPASSYTSLDVLASGTAATHEWEVGLAEDDCLVVVVGDAASTCQFVGELSGGSVGYGGTHLDLSLGWAITGAAGASSAEFVLLDGTVIRGDEIPGLSVPTTAWVLVVPAGNEIVGVEVLAADGALIASLPIGDP
jgi:hypothetical protein